ncbi:MAG: phosphopantetheine-binding protein [Fimbriimonas sp.]
MRVFLCAGEASGDAYGAALVEEIRRLSSPLGAVSDDQPLSSLFEDSLDAVELLMSLEDELETEIADDEFGRLSTVGDLRRYVTARGGTLPEGPAIRFQGVGGPKLKSAGVRLVRDSSGWGVISIFQVLRRLPTLVSGFRAAKNALSVPPEREGIPGLFIPIDFGYMNIRLARHAKKLGWKVLYFVPPGSWRRDRQGPDLPHVTDAIVTPFEWSAEILKSMGANAHWFGHPIKQLLERVGGRGARSEAVIAVLPGSREHEIELNLPLISETFRKLSKDLRAEFALAPSVDSKSFKTKWETLSGRTGDAFTAGQTSQVLNRAKAAIVCSGTATLEAALCRCPMVVVYKLSKGMELEAKLLRIKRPKYIALPNILMDAPVVPELVQQDATPQNVATQLEKLLKDSSLQLREFEKLDELLGPSDAITQAAILACEMLKS